jgi:CBS domain-containing protein
MKVEQLMTREVKVCRADETLNRAAQLIWERDCGFIPAIASSGDGALVGVVTEHDIAMATYTQGKPPLAIPLSSVRARKTITCRVEDDITQAEALMRTSQARRLPVVDLNGRVLESSRSKASLEKSSARKRAGRRCEVSAESLAVILAAIGKPRLICESSPVDLEYVE